MDDDCYLSVGAIIGEIVVEGDFTIVVGTAVGKSPKQCGCYGRFNINC